MIRGPQFCECMFAEQSDGSSRCRQCNGDIYACECPVRHSPRCDDFVAPTEDELADVFGVDDLDTIADDLYGDFLEFVAKEEELPVCACGPGEPWCDGCAYSIAKTGTCLPTVKK